MYLNSENLFFQKFFWLSPHQNSIPTIPTDLVGLHQIQDLAFLIPTDLVGLHQIQDLGFLIPTYIVGHETSKTGSMYIIVINKDLF